MLLKNTRGWYTAYTPNISLAVPMDCVKYWYWFFDIWGKTREANAYSKQSWWFQRQLQRRI